MRQLDPPVCRWRPLRVTNSTDTHTYVTIRRIIYYSSIFILKVTRQWISIIRCYEHLPTSLSHLTYPAITLHFFFVLFNAVLPVAAWASFVGCTCNIISLNASINRFTEYVVLLLCCIELKCIIIIALRGFFIFHFCCCYYYSPVLSLFYLSHL